MRLKHVVHRTLPFPCRPLNNKTLKNEIETFHGICRHNFRGDSQ